ncbi:hypothetical protein [Flavobacterium sp.]|uniref:hypothetical protein n=1 Tax=Flavobacterium sp. TaxID=239 RepID=UPI0040489C23
MKLVIKSLLVVVFISILSCRNHLDKSVIEPIEIEKLKTIIEKDTLFEYTYKVVQKIRDEVLTDDVQKAKWSDITYERVHNIIKFYSDSVIQSKYTTEIRKEWLNKYDKYDKKADSIANYWQKYLAENSLKNYVNIELFDVQTSENGSVKVGFKISPLKNGLEDLYFEYIFIDKKEITEILKWDNLSILNNNSNKFYLFEEIPKAKIYWETNIKNADALKNQILEKVLDKYIFKHKIISLSQNGKRFSEYDIEIPNKVQYYLDAKKEKSVLQDYYKTDLIKEFLNNDYVEYQKYISPFIDSIAKSKDSKVLDFFVLKKAE